LLLGTVACQGETGIPSSSATGEIEPIDPVEASVLLSVQKMIRDSGGRVTFSDLHNDPRFGSEERAFLGRLYETFFQIPAYLRSQHRAGEKIPTRQQIGENFGISKNSVELLLQVMEKDPRMPQLFSRDSATRKILTIDAEVIDAFIARRGGSVKVTSWEGEELPDFELQRLDGSSSLSRADLEGQGSLIYFWFSGCPPCVRIAPHLAELDKKYRSSGFRMVGFNADKVLSIPTTDKKREAYLARTGTTYPNLQLTRETLEAFGNVNVYPTLFLSGSDLRVNVHLINYQNLETLTAAIEQVMGH
jgi:thiol-disulfide isomerase/thioredoxin